MYNCYFLRITCKNAMFFEINIHEVWLYRFVGCGRIGPSCRTDRTSTKSSTSGSGSTRNRCSGSGSSSGCSTSGCGWWLLS